MALGLEVVKISAATGKVILFVTHSASEAITLSDKVLVLHGGAISHVEHVTAGRPRSLLQRCVAEQIHDLEVMLAQFEEDGK